MNNVGNVSIRHIDEIDRTLWDDYVFNHQYGNIFQTTHYLFLHRHKSVYFGLAVFVEGKIAGLVGGVIYSNYIFPVSYLTRRAVIIGGPLVDQEDKDLYGILLKAIVKELKNRSVYIQVRNLREMEILKKQFNDCRFQYFPHLDIWHDLTEDAEIIRSKINKNKRKNVSKSQNRGSCFEIVTDRDIFEKCVKLVHNTYKKIGLPCPGRDFFLSAFDKLAGAGFLKTFVIKTEELVIGARMELCYKGMVYDWYAGADDRFKNRYPNDFLPYHILFWGKENGFVFFDFGGAGKPDKPYGVRDHKIKFGGKLVSPGRYERVNFRLIYLFSSYMLKVKSVLKIG